MADLATTLHSLANDPEAAEETKFFIRDKNRVSDLESLINAGANRATFLKIPGITVEIYRNIRNMLNDCPLGAEARIIARRGRAGGLTVVNTVGVVQQPEIDVKAAEDFELQQDNLVDQEFKFEKEYYPLVKAWAIGDGYVNCEITGGKLPGFKWENPDLISIDCIVNEFTRSVTFDITSFEVKLKVEPYGVWQAAHYKRFSVEVYIAFAKSEKTIREQDEGRIFELAVELGLGVLAFEDKKFKVIQSPKGDVPQESKVNETLANFKNVFDASAIQTASAELDRHYKKWMQKIFGGGSE